MAPRGPLLASLRVCVQNMQADGGVVTDSSPHLPSCCELVPRKGLQRSPLFEHHYPESSCVGRFAQPDYSTFAFCVADSPESPQSTGFCCIVLKSSNTKECEDIVCSIATGFKHTEWFV